jgi:ADP-heptose:LPS heptosyltransferase
MGRLPAEPPAWSLRIPDAHGARAADLLAPFEGALVVGLHVSGGRAVKQWPEARFGEVAAHLARERGAAIVLTGTPAERAQIDVVRGALPPARVLDLSSLDLLTAAAVIARLDLFVTGDTGPMHLAHAVGTPIVAVFGPSDPRRYAPRGLHDTIVRIDLPCSPCNRIRQPPARCTGHTPDCLAGISTAQVVAAIDDALRARPGGRSAHRPEGSRA